MTMTHYCPHCKHLLNTHSEPLNDPGSIDGETLDDMTICVYCGAVLLVAANGLQSVTLDWVRKNCTIETHLAVLRGLKIVHELWRKQHERD
jgi:hypothetical protein